METQNGLSRKGSLKAQFPCCELEQPQLQQLLSRLGHRSRAERRYKLPTIICRRRLLPVWRKGKHSRTPAVERSAGQPAAHRWKVSIAPLGVGMDALRMSPPSHTWYGCSALQGQQLLQKQSLYLHDSCTNPKAPSLWPSTQDRQILLGCPCHLHLPSASPGTCVEVGL